MLTLCRWCTRWQYRAIRCPDIREGITTPTIQGCGEGCVLQCSNQGCGVGRVQYVTHRGCCEGRLVCVTLPGCGQGCMLSEPVRTRSFVLSVIMWSRDGMSSSNALLVCEMWYWADELLSCRGHDTQNRLLHAGSPGVPQESRRGRERAKKTPLGSCSCSLGPCWLLHRVAISFRARAAPSQQLLQEGAKPKIEVTSDKRLAMEPATNDKSPWTRFV